MLIREVKRAQPRAGRVLRTTSVLEAWAAIAGKANWTMQMVDYLEQRMRKI